MPGTVPGEEKEPNFPASWSWHPSWNRKTINATIKRVSDRMLKGDLHYGKGNGKTEQVREMGDAGVGTLFQSE